MTDMSGHLGSVWARVLVRALILVERWIVDVLPRGMRRRYREKIDRLQARLHSRVHPDHDARR